MAGDDDEIVEDELEYEESGEEEGHNVDRDGIRSEENIEISGALDSEGLDAEWDGLSFDVISGWK